MTRVVATGTAGFLGSHPARPLLAEGTRDAAPAGLTADPANLRL